jgi:hypothetical protein
VELDDKSIERIKACIRTELPPALERIWNERAPLMQAAITADVVTQTRSEVRKDHAENRVRLQNLETTASAAERCAAAADLKAGAILDRVAEHYESSKRTEEAVGELTKEWATAGGLRAGKKAERARWIGWVQAGAGILSGGGILKLIEYIHHH